jgi:hypothetical protein
MSILIENASTFDRAIYFARGHFDLEEFKKAAQAYAGQSLSHFDEPEQLWWRSIPSRDDEYRTYYHDAEAKSRGAFRVTVMARY